jgi:hypothetical protein
VRNLGGIEVNRDCLEQDCRGLFEHAPTAERDEYGNHDAEKWVGAGPIEEYYADACADCTD